ncbi:MAG TPA: CxxxxCH/CxxCH domain-containing protein [Anaeromyxobacteraceae bacterium]|nr:CxxxxCH/CxxCH domain-containing protein [Anaeromyxobacteraceae bacterium]
MKERLRHAGSRAWRPALALAVAILVGRAGALNRVANWGLENAAEPGGSWTEVQTQLTATQDSFARSTAQARQGTYSFYGTWHGTGNNQRVDKSLTQAFTPASNVNARLRAYYRRQSTGAVDSFAFTVKLRNGATDVLTAVNVATTGTDAAWQGGTWTADAALTGGTTYTLEARWVAQVDNGEYQGAYLDDLQMQVSPGSVTATPIAGTTGVRLSWTSTAGPNGPALRATNPYQIAWGTSSPPGTTLLTGTVPYDHGGLTGNTTYFYQVSDFDAGDVESPRSVEVSVLTFPDAPGTPAFSGVTSGNVTVSWAAPAGGAASYRVERAPDVAGAPGAWQEVAAGVSSPWSDGTVAPGTTYWYRVRGSNASGDGAYSGAASVTTATTVPGAPGTPGFTNVAQTSLRASWTAASGATSYKVERAPDASGAPGAWQEIAAGVATTSHDDSGLSPATTYWYRVRGTNANGDGPYSNAASVTTLVPLPGAPGTPTYSNVGSTALRVSWTSATDASTYKVERAPDASGAPGAWAQIASAVATTWYDDSGLSPSTRYWYRVRATNAAGDGLYSAASSVVTAPPAAELVVTGTAQPAAGNVAAGSVKTYVGELDVSAVNANATITAIRVGNLGTAVAGADVQSLQLWADSDANGTLGAADALLATSSWSSALSRYVFSGLSTTVTSGAPAKRLFVTLNAALGATPTRTFRMSVSASDVTVGAPATVQPFTVSGNTFTLVAGTSEGDPTGGSLRPMVLVVNPGENVAVTSDASLGFRVQVRVYSPSALSSTPELSTDGGTTFPISLALSAQYGGSATDGVYEAEPKLSPGAYVLVARATNAAGTVQSGKVIVTVNSSTSGAGDGNLLVRDDSSQLCTDCHALKTHSSQSTSNKHGSWAVSCRACHAPHGTPNIFLVNPAITPPAVNGPQPQKPVYFSRRTGVSGVAGASDKANASYVNTDYTGVCQVCHTRTDYYRNQVGGNAHETGPCAACHAHDGGFKGVGTCSLCHLVAGPDQDDYVYANAVKATIAQGEWTVYGHGASAAYASGNVGASFDGQGAAVQDRGCAYCHTDAVGHGVATNFFRLANTGGADGTNGACLVCHKTGSAGFDPDGAGTSYASRNGRPVDQSHYGAKHGASPLHDGGRFCWDCHDPHGDASALGNPLWYMVQRQPVEDSDASDLPAALAAAVEFRADLGGNVATLDYADYVANGVGLCRNCHDDGVVNHYSKTLSDGHNSTPGLTANSRCTDCHRHRNGFQASCNTCHAAPPNVGKHLSHDQVASLPTSYGVTASHATQTQYGFGCGKCHQGTHFNDTGGTLADPYLVDVVFDTGGTYTRSTSQSEQGPDGSWFSWSNGTCGNVYCHSRANPLGGTDAFASPTFAQAGALGCTSCHDGAGAATTLSPAHRIHTDPARYGLGCVRCHVATVSDDATVSDKRNHADGGRDVAFDTSGPNNSGGSYSYGTAPAYTCANTYCHSNGQDVAAPFTSGPSIAWNVTRSCTSCHLGNAASGTPMASGRHGAHVNAAGTLGTNHGCVDCHATVVTGDTAIAAAGFAQHVDGGPDVAPSTTRGPNSATWSYAAGTCSGFYCHSSGQATPTYRTPGWAGAALGCNGCHGTGTGTGAPDYASGGAGATTANSHAAHVSSGADCVTCHIGTASWSGSAQGIVTSSTLHTDGQRQVGFDTARAGASASYTAGGATPKQCSNVACHGGNAVQWGATLQCSSCHLAPAGAGDQDLDDWVYGNATLALVDREDWLAYGHGTTAAYAQSGNAPANFTVNDGCMYCHSGATALKTGGETSVHGDAANPFRLANAGWNGTGKNGVCLVCHDPAGPGFDPDGATATYPLRDASAGAQMSAYHYGADHSVTGDGGQYCWDCHDPHGDYNYTVGTARAIAFMIHEQPVKNHDGDGSGTGGWGIPAASGGLALAVDFNKAATGGAATFDWGDYVDSTATGGLYNGVCQVCHTSASVNNFRQDLYTAGHNNTQACVACHDHEQPPSDAFKPAGGDCLGCHGGTPQNGRRAVAADFTKTSHHAGNSTTAWLRGTLTANDCVVCHAEGDATGQGQPPQTGALHMNGIIDLRNADSATASFPYDKSGMPAASADWNSASATWRTQTSTNLDPFCLSCHDSNGATQTYLKGDSGALALNPFADSVNGAAVSNNVTNSVDQLTRPGVVDIKSKVSGAPPAQGSFARHAIRGQSTSKYVNYTTAAAWPSNPNGYSTIYSASRFVQRGTDESGRPNWNDASVMGCADCHTSDGANTTAGNAHGSNSEYLLKDASGGATTGSYAGGTYNCFRCHPSGSYTEGHTNGNGSDFQDTAGQTGSARITAATKGYGTIFGIACLNCHGGARGNGAGTGDTNGFGWIHGTSQVFATGASGGSGTRNAYRFMNGGGLRYYVPGNASWDSGSGTCYTLGAADTWSGCQQHSGTSKPATTLKRPLTY